MGPIGCPKTLVRNCYLTLRNIPEEHKSLVHPGGCLKSSTFHVCVGALRVGRYTADCSSVLFRWETDLGKEFVERLDSTRASSRSRQNRVWMQLYLPLEN